MVRVSDKFENNPESLFEKKSKELNNALYGKVVQDRQAEVAFCIEAPKGKKIANLSVDLVNKAKKKDEEDLKIDVTNEGYSYITSDGHYGIWVAIDSNKFINKTLRLNKTFSIFDGQRLDEKEIINEVISAKQAMADNIKDNLISTDTEH